MSDEIPIIYLSKRCEHCLTLIEILRKRSDLNGNYRLVMIDDEPFPNYVKSVPCMVSGLAYYLSMKYAPQLTQQMKLLYEDEFQRALQEDGSASSTYITPKAYYPGA